MGITVATLFKSLAMFHMNVTTETADLGQI